MKASRKTVIGCVAILLTLAGGQGARAGEADEIALAERIAELATRLGGTAGAAPFRASMLDGAGRLAEKEVRFRRERLRAAEATNDLDGMLAAILEWRKLDPGDLFVQKRQMDVYVMRMQTADEKLAYLSRIVDTPGVDAEVRSHAAAKSAAVLVEQARAGQALEMLRKSLQLNGVNIDAMRLHWQLAINQSTPLQRLDLLLAMLKANPASIDVVLLVAGELANANLVQQSLQWYGHAASMSRSLGELIGAPAKDYAAELLIAGQDRAAAEVASRLLERDAADPGAWFLTVLAERGMKDRIGEVKKNALIGLLNRVAMVRRQIGVQDATTRPLGAPDVPTPNLAGDTALLKNASKEVVRDYVACVSDAIWFLLAYSDQPADAQPMLQVLIDSEQVNPNLIARLEGWSLLKTGKFEEARAKLGPLADTDPLAGVGLVRIYQQDPASAVSATDLARKLVMRYPSHAIGAMVRCEVGDIAGGIQPDPATEPMLDALDRFPREVFRIAVQPQEFLSMRLAPLQVGHDFSEPVLIEVELRNIQNVPIVVGPSGIARDYWLDVKFPGMAMPVAQGAVFERIEGPTVLWPGRSVKWVTRLDRGPLARLMQRTMIPIQMQVLGLTNAVPGSKGIVPGPCGIRGSMRQMLERRPAVLADDKAIQQANTIVDGSDLVLKLRLIDQVAAHVLLAADPEGPQAIKAMDAEFRDLLVRLGHDAAPTVRAWARYRAGQTGVEPPEKTATDLLSEAVWYSRLLGATMAIDTPEAVRPKLLATAGDDTDATVRRTALAIPAAMAAQTESKKQ